MNRESKIATLLIVFMMLISTFAATSKNHIAIAQQEDAKLTGTIADRGNDTDGDGKYDYLEVAVEINVSLAGDYTIMTNYLLDQNDSSLPINSGKEGSLEAGMRWLNLSFYGPRIYANHFNPRSIFEIYLYEGGKSLGMISNVQLSRVYNFAEFDGRAYLTGTIHDEGVDTDGDGLFNNLKIGIEVNVTYAATYRIAINGLRGEGYSTVSASNYSKADLSIGVHTLNISVLSAGVYSSHVNVTMIATIDLLLFNNETYVAQLQTAYDRPLSRRYSYAEFDPYAFLIETISDEGIDTDRNGLFDYLAIGIRINVTDAGNYSLYARSLVEDKGFGLHSYLWEYRSTSAQFSTGLHTIYFNYSGLMLQYRHFSPTHIGDLGLESTDPYAQLEYVSLLALPTKYNYSQFDHPLNDMELEFTIHPNATIGVIGNFNHTRIYPLPEEPKFNATFDISTAGNMTTATANGTMAVPESQIHQWPFNSTEAKFLAQYQNGMLNAWLNASVSMPPAARTGSPFNSTSGDLTLTAAYSGGLVSINLDGIAQLSPQISSQFPFNISDLTVLANYANKEIVGNITFHTIGGFTLGDVIVNLRGNETNFVLKGYINVVYGNYFGMNLNATTVEELRQNYTRDLPGQSPGSLYNITKGMVECTRLDTTSTPIGTNGTRIDYNATLAGNFTDALAKLIMGMFTLQTQTPQNEQIIYAALKSAFASVQNASLRLNFYDASKIADVNLVLKSDVKELWRKALQIVLATVPAENRTMVETWLKIANATAYAIENAQLKAVYSGDQQKLDLNASLSVNLTQLKDDVKRFLSDAVPSSLHDAFEIYLNVTYAELDSSAISYDYTDGTAKFMANCTLEGDFATQTNQAKNLLVKISKAMNPGNVDWETRLLNDTEVDVRNFHISVRQGEDWSTIGFNGVKISPQRDTIDFIRFKLSRWLNLATDPQAPPLEFERLKIIVTAGFNGTHTVLLYAPGNVPAPDSTSLDYKSMMWQNDTMSSLKDLLFKIAYQGVVNYVGQKFYVPMFTNSTVSSFGFNPGAKRISFNVTGVSGTGFCNITIPKALVYASPSEWVVKIDGNTLPLGQFNVTENAEYVFMNLNYTHSSHLIELEGTWVVTEFPTGTLLLTLTAIALIAVAIVFRQRKRLGSLRLKYQSAVNMFLNKLHHMRT